jgi:RPA family protein
MTAREIAWRVLAAEVGASRVEEKGDGPKATSHLLSPYGARMSRVLLAGWVDPPATAAGVSGFLRSRLVDPSGEVPLTAGSYQPRGLAGLGSITETTSMLVVGKAHLYRGRDGSVTPSIRVEGARKLLAPELRSTYAEILEHTRVRLDLVTGRPDAAHPPRCDRAAPPARWLEAARGAAARYPDVDRDRFRRQLAEVEAVVSGPGGGAPPPKGPRAPASIGPTVTVTRTAPNPIRTDEPAPTAAERAHESAFLDVVDELAEESMDGYADLRQVFQRCAGRGLSETHAEELLDRLEEAGTIEEPIVGRLRRS